ncbi:MAG: hypothetical protein QXO70_04810 [Candidatus Pacearchaeota archaeon]
MKWLHKFNKRKQTEEFDPEFYRRTKTVPLAWQVYGKHKIGDIWLPLSQQRKTKEDAEKDLRMLRYSVTTKIPPLFKEIKLIQVPASPSEMSQRKLFKKLRLKGTKKGTVESIYGTIAESKWGGTIPLKFFR